MSNLPNEPIQRTALRAAVDRHRVGRIRLAVLIAMGLTACSRSAIPTPPSGALRWEYKLVMVADLTGTDPALDANSPEDVFALFAAQKSDAELEELKAKEGGADFFRKVEAVKDRRRDNEEALLDGLNKLGAEGWEVASVDNGQLLLKRQRD